MPRYPWTRRHLLRMLSGAAGTSLIPRTLRASAATGAPAFSRFADIAASAGLTRPTIYGGEETITYIVEITGCGCAFIDYDNDGWMDIFMLSGQRLEGTPPGVSNRLYHNNRDGTFSDVTEKAGLKSAGWAMGVCAGDYNNDGYDDLFVTYYGQNRLYRNNGNGTFTDVTERAGLLQEGTHFGTGCTFIERNRNGWLDLFISNYVEIDLVHGPRPSTEVANCNFKGVPTNCGPGGLPAPRHYLYRNNGDGTFTDVSRESHIADLSGSYALSALVCDVDEDGWPDIFVACDASFSFLLMNNGDGTFREEALARGVAVNSFGRRMGGMGVATGDYTLDGHLDLIKTHFGGEATGVYLNDGKGYFEDASEESGLFSERRYICWGTGLPDLDNDGWPDLFIVSGTVYPELEKYFPSQFPAKSPRLLFRNQGGKFTRMGDEAGPDICSLHSSRGTAFGDFDNDGDLDILIMNRNEPPTLLRNDAPPGNHWIKIRLEGTKSNRSAIGARVLARYNGHVQAQMLTSQSSYLSVNDRRLHFGLGSAASADVEIFWPSGARENYKNLAAGKLHTIREGQEGSRD